MSVLRYEENCPGCRPVAVDLQTGKPCAADHPLTLAIDKVWAAAGPVTKQAFHRVTCLNSRDPLDLSLVMPFLRSMKELARKV